ncbi:tetratricopeptide repeat protein [Myxococcota bacterium]|nr:tetratricopeptide repeat protein [Myxococcota bacterium]
MAENKLRDKKLEQELEELDEAIESGELILPVEPTPDLSRTFTGDNVEKFIMGDITWAELQGMTMEEAYALAQVGYGLYEESRYHDARTMFEGLIVCNPYDAYFHSMLGAVYQQLDMDEEALAEYTIAIDLDEELLHAYVNRAEMHLRNGQFEEALQDLKKAMSLDPEGKDPNSPRAFALASATTKALGEIQKFLANK